MYVLWGVEAFIRTQAYYIFRNKPIRMNASTPYEGMLARGHHR